MKKICLYLTVFVVTFIGISFFVPKEEKQENLGDNETIYGDREDYGFNFNEKTIINEKIVAFDNTSTDYVRYFVVEFSNNQYVSYSYYFLKSHNQYLDVYNEHVKTVVDYNYDELMLKTLDDISYATYDEFIYNIQELIDDNSIYLIY